jgi:ribosome assembly protein YihI (activator of Der GTPase)
MTPQLEAAIAAIQPLSVLERQQVLNLLLKSVDKTSLLQQSTAFWQDQTIAQLKTAQKIVPIASLKDLVADFWSEEDSIEDFLTFLKTQRQDTAL